MSDKWNLVFPLIFFKCCLPKSVDCLTGIYMCVAANGKGVLTFSLLWGCPACGYYMGCSWKTAGVWSPGGISGRVLHRGVGVNAAASAPLNPKYCSKRSSRNQRGKTCLSAQGLSSAASPFPAQRRAMRLGGTSHLLSGSYPQPPVQTNGAALSLKLTPQLVAVSPVWLAASVLNLLTSTTYSAEG